MNTLQAVKSVLGFYEALGFERMPVAITRAEWLKILRNDIGDCTRCRLSKARKTVVFGDGNPRARLMFIGEGPGKEEDIQGKPFVGDAGQLLTRLIERMGFKREDVYIANIVKCRPPSNRDPKDDEIAACLPILKKQIRMISPEVIMTLGRIAAQALLEINTPISRLRGKFIEYEGIYIMPTFHPAYLLRNPKDKILVWADAQKVLSKLGVEVQ
jgi:DNA polymerase